MRCKFAVSDFSLVSFISFAKINPGQNTNKILERNLETIVKDNIEKRTYHHYKRIIIYLLFNQLNLPNYIFNIDKN